MKSKNALQEAVGGLHEFLAKSAKSKLAAKYGKKPEQAAAAEPSKESESGQEGDLEELMKHYSKGC